MILDLFFNDAVYFVLVVVFNAIFWRKKRHILIQVIFLLLTMIGKTTAF